MSRGSQVVTTPAAAGSAEAEAEAVEVAGAPGVSVLAGLDSPSGVVAGSPPPPHAADAKKIEAIAHEERIGRAMGRAK